jgi:hypothetical protein
MLKLSRLFVIVWGEQHEVSVTRLSKTECRALGEYRSHVIESIDRTPLTALKRWKAAAQCRSGISITIARRDKLADLGIPKD